MSETQNLRAELDQRLLRLVDEVTQTRSASDAVGVAVAGLRDEVAALRADMAAKISPDDLARIDAVIAGFDGIQADLTRAAGVNVDDTPPGGGDTQPGGDDTVPAPPVDVGDMPVDDPNMPPLTPNSPTL